MKRLKAWLQAANGWRRLWFVLSTLGLLYCTLINPFVLNRQNDLSHYQYMWAVEKEFQNPECRLYAIKPLAELTQPEYNDSEGREGCYHLYNYRRNHNENKVPYTPEELASDFSKAIWGEILMLSGIGIVVAVVLSTLVYFFGTVVAWVRAGFRKEPLSAGKGGDNA